MLDCPADGGMNRIKHYHKIILKVAEVKLKFLWVGQREGVDLEVGQDIRLQCIVYCYSCSCSTIVVQQCHGTL